MELNPVIDGVIEYREFKRVKVVVPIPSKRRVTTIGVLKWIQRNPEKELKDHPVKIVLRSELGPVILGFMISYGVDTKRCPQKDRVFLEEFSSFRRNIVVSG